MKQERYIDPTQAAGQAFIARNIAGEIVMLNLLRFRAVADYSAAPELAPETPITGQEAYQCYVAHTLPHLREVGGDLLFTATGGAFLIGPPGAGWDLVMLVRHRSVGDFCPSRTTTRILPVWGIVSRLSRIPGCCLWSGFSLATVIVLMR